MSEEEGNLQQKVGINKEEWEEKRREGQEHNELYYFLKIWEHPQTLISTRHKSVDVH